MQWQPSNVRTRTFGTKRYDLQNQTTINELVKIMASRKTTPVSATCELNSFKHQSFAIETNKKIEMATEIITPDDLENFRLTLVENIRELLSENQPVEQPEKETIWLKSHQVQRMLGISPGTLQNLRINGTLPYSKVGGVIFYDRKEIMEVMEMNKRNAL